jgi:hypothetical protein
VPMNRQSGFRGGVGVLAIVMLTGACGTTLHRNAAGVSQGSSSTGGLAATDSGTTGLASGGGAASGAAGAVASPTGSTSGGGAADSTLSVGPGATTLSPTATTAGDGPGVSATTINVAEAYSPGAGAADAALGAANTNPGDTKTETDAVIKYINDRGGIAHRKLIPIWYQIDSSQTASTSEQAACATWTQDHKVFFLGGGSSILNECTAKEHAIGVTSGGITSEDSQILQQYPADIDLTGLTNDRAMKLTINGLAAQGYFAKGAKVGIATWDQSDFAYSIAHAAVPALAALGIRNVPVKYLAVPQSTGDLGATSASVSSAVLQFHSAGIDHVLLFDGPAGINNSATLVLLWTQVANAQGYYPRYGLNSTSGLTATVPDFPEQQIANSLAVGWTPFLDIAAADFPPSALDADAKRCLEIMSAAGQVAANQNQRAVQIGICETLFFLKKALDPIPGPLNAANALAAVNAIGSRYQPMQTFGTYLSATRHDGASLIRNASYFHSCKCFRYTSAPYDPE